MYSTRARLCDRDRSSTAENRSRTRSASGSRWLQAGADQHARPPCADGEEFGPRSLTGRAAAPRRAAPHASHLPLVQPENSASSGSVRGQHLDPLAPRRRQLAGGPPGRSAALAVQAAQELLLAVPGAGDPGGASWAWAEKNPPRAAPGQAATGGSLGHGRPRPAPPGLPRSISSASWTLTTATGDRGCPYLHECGFGSARPAGHTGGAASVRRVEQALARQDEEHGGSRPPPPRRRPGPYPPRPSAGYDAPASVGAARPPGDEEPQRGHPAQHMGGGTRLQSRHEQGLGRTGREPHRHDAAHGRDDADVTHSSRNAATSAAMDSATRRSVRSPPGSARAAGRRASHRPAAPSSPRRG